MLGLDTDDRVSVMLFRNAEHALGWLCLPDLENGVLEFWRSDGQRLIAHVDGPKRRRTAVLLPDDRGIQLDVMAARLQEWFSRAGKPLAHAEPRQVVREAIDRAELG